MATSRTVLKSTGAALAVSLLSAHSAWAQPDFLWDVAGPGDWSNPDNWDTGNVPDGGAGNFAFINNGGIAEITSDINPIQDPFVGQGAGMSGTLNHSAGGINLDAGGWMFVGTNGGTGTYNMSGTATMSKDRLYVGGRDNNDGGTGTLTMSGSAAINNGEVNTGNGGSATATVTLSENAVINTFVFRAGFDPGGAVGNGVVTFSMSDNAQLNTGGNAELKNGTFDINDNASIDASGEIWFGDGAGSTAVVDMDSGTVESDSWIAVGRASSTGTLNLSGDAQLIRNGANDHFITVGGLGEGNGGTINISGNASITSNTNLVLSETAGRYGIVNQSGGTVTLNDNTHPNFQDSLELDAADSGMGEYNLSGGVLNLVTVDASTGTFNMTGGELHFTTWNGNLTQGGGTLAPGNSPGTSTVNGNYSLAAGELEIEIEGPTAGTEYDQLVVNGAVSLAGALSIVSNAGGLGDSFIIISNDDVDAVSGTFSSVNTTGGYAYSVDYAGGDGNDVVLTVTAVPEPGTLALAALGGLCFLRRRR